MKITPNDVLRFVLELLGVAGLAYWGWHATREPAGQIAVAVLAPAALVATWAMVVAPKARNAIPQKVRFVIGSGILLLSALGVGLAGQGPMAAAFAAAIVLNTAVQLAS